MDAMPSDPEEARRALKFFQNEASLAGKLRHPHIVSIFDAGIDKKDGKDLRYLVMELVEGTSLQPHCGSSGLLPTRAPRRSPTSAARRSNTPTPWASVHRDIKPANIMLRPTSTSRCRTSAPRSSRARTPRRSPGVGSPAYMSPEQIRGSEEIDFRSDMFSLGGVMYHMLTGARPFSGSTAYELMDEILSKEPPPPFAGASDYPDGAG
jgi:serine/threonine protein kinase